MRDGWKCKHRLFGIPCLLDGRGNLTAHHGGSALVVQRVNIYNVCTSSFGGASARRVRGKHAHLAALRMNCLGARLLACPRKGAQRSWRHRFFEGFKRRSTRFVQLGKADAHTLVEPDFERIGTCQREWCCAHAIDMVPHVIRRNGLRTRRLHDIAGKGTRDRRICGRVERNAQGFADTHLNFTDDWDTRFQRIIDIRGSRIANAKYAIALANLLEGGANAQATLPDNVSLHERVGEMPARRPELQHVTCLNRTFNLDGHHAIPRGIHTAHQNATVVRPLVAHHVVAGLANQVCLGKPTRKCFGEDSSLFMRGVFAARTLLHPIENRAIHAHDSRYVLWRFHSAFNLQRSNARFDELREHVDGAQVFR